MSSLSRRRTAIVSGPLLRTRPSGAPIPLTYFGGLIGPSAYQAARTTKAWEDWALNSEEHLYIDQDPDNVGFLFDALTPPRRSVSGGSLKSIITAASGFAPFSATFFEVNETLSGTIYENFSLVGGSGVDLCFGNDTETADTPTARIQARGLSIHGGVEYAVGFTGGPGAFLSTPGVGARFENCFLKPATSNGGWISLTQGCDDMIFDQLRCSMPGGEMNNSLILVGGTINNLSFNSIFMNVVRDYLAGSSADSIVKIGSGAKVVHWRGTYFEPNGRTYSKLKYFFDVESGHLDASDIWMQNTSSAVVYPVGAAIAKVRNGNVSIRDCDAAGGSTNMNHVCALEVGGQSSAVHVDLDIAGNDTAGVPVVSSNGVATGSDETAHIAGVHAGVTYDHNYSHDGTDVILTPAGTVSIDDTDSPYTVQETDKVILADASSGAITINLLPAASGSAPIVQKVDATNNVTIDGDGSETINGASTLVLSSQWGSTKLTPAAGAYHSV